jgi:hypothetical protein
MVFAMTRNMVFGFYAVLIVALAGVGFYMGKSKGKPELYAAAGAAVGAVLSALLWQFWAKKKYSTKS